MKQGRESQTAVIVCMARASADGAPSVEKFADPTALALLPESARARVLRFRAGTSNGIRERIANSLLRRRANMMIARTVAIDDAVRGNACPQLVILGAGLDGRAWRMPELRDTLVFEVDHPDSQRAKRERVAAGALVPTAREIRFVPVDFTRDDLEDALTAAGHDRASATCWIWEGVVMYLTQPEIEATLAVIERRSAAGSRLVVAYHSPTALLALTGPYVRRLGEPLRSVFRADAMRALLTNYAFHIVRDDALPSIAAELSTDLGQATRGLKHLRIAIADRVSPA